MIQWQISVQTFPAELLDGEAGTFVAVPTGTLRMENYGVQARMKPVDAQVWQNIKLSALRQQAAQNEFQSLDIIRERYDNCAEIHNLIAQQFDRGQTDKISLNQSANLLKEQEENRFKAEISLQNALLDLKFRMGLPLDAELPVSSNKMFLTPKYARFNVELLPNYDVQRIEYVSNMIVNSIKV